MTSYVVNSPFRVQVSKLKKFTLNLNQYRNTHFHVLNKAKVVYKQEVADQINKLPVFNVITLIITVYPATHRLFDIGNVCCIHEKFFLDSLVELGKLPDDNYTFCPSVMYQVGQVDKHNPRCEIEINEYNSKV